MCRELITFLDMAYHYGSDSDKRKAEKLQTQLLQDDTKEAGVLNRVLQSMRQFKKHDKKVPRQEGRESRGYAVDMVKMLHVVLRVYERICKSGFVIQREPMTADAQDMSSDDESAGSDYDPLNPEQGSPKKGDRGDKADVDSDAEMNETGQGEGAAQAATSPGEADAVEQPATPRASPPAEEEGTKDAAAVCPEVAASGLEDEVSDGAAEKENSAAVKENSAAAEKENSAAEELQPQQQQKKKKPKVFTCPMYLLSLLMCL